MLHASSSAHPARTRTWRTHDHCTSARHRFHLRLCRAGLGGAGRIARGPHRGVRRPPLPRRGAALGRQARPGGARGPCGAPGDRDRTDPGARRPGASGHSRGDAGSRSSACRFRSTARRVDGGARPGPAPERPAVVRHLRRAVPRQLARAQPGRRPPARDCQVRVPVGGRHLRRVRLHGRQPAQRRSRTVAGRGCRRGRPGRRGGADRDRLHLARAR